LRAQVIAARRAADRGQARRRAGAQQPQVQPAAGMQRERMARRPKPRHHRLGQHVAGVRHDREPRAARQCRARRDQRLVTLQCRHRSPVPLLRQGARQVTLARAPVDALVPAVAHRDREGLDLRPLAPRHIALELARPGPQGVARPGPNLGQQPPALHRQPAGQPVSASAGSACSASAASSGSARNAAASPGCAASHAIPGSRNASARHSASWEFSSVEIAARRMASAS
jgi:hypothetical protein